MSTVRTHLTLDSRNRKLRAADGPPIAATYRPHSTCPRDCPFLPTSEGGPGGCYAAGRIAAIARRGDESAQAVADRIIADVPHGGYVRHAVVGDLLDADGRVDQDYLNACRRIVAERPDIRHIAYTHAWRTIGDNPFPFVVNASVEDPADVPAARALGYATVTVAADDRDPILAADGMTRCPAETRDTGPGSACNVCGLCSRDRRATVVFVAHGSGAGRVRQTLADARR